jgi:hypothetical protein
MSGKATELGAKPSVQISIKTLIHSHKFSQRSRGYCVYTAYNAYLSGYHAVYPNMNIELMSLSLRLPVVPLPSHMHHYKLSRSRVH